MLLAIVTVVFLLWVVADERRALVPVDLPAFVVSVVLFVAGAGVLVVLAGLFGWRVSGVG